MKLIKKMTLQFACLTAICCGFASSISNAVELTPSSFGRIQDNATLGSNGGTSDSVNNSAGYLYIGDHDNDKAVFQLGFMFNMDQDWSFVNEATTFSLTFQVDEVQGEGWSRISLMHVPAYGYEAVSSASIITGGVLIGTFDTSKVRAGGTIVFDVTDIIKSNIQKGSKSSVFRLQQEVLFNNKNGARDALRLNALATLTASSGK